MSDMGREGAQIGYLYGSMLRGFEELAKAFKAGFERGHTGRQLTAVEAYELRERRRILAYQRRIEQERAKGCRHVDRLLADLRKEVGLR